MSIMSIFGIILVCMFILASICCLPEIVVYLTNRRQSQNLENEKQIENNSMNSNYIYLLEYTGYEMDDPYYGADFRPIFISLDEAKVIELFNKELEASKNKPDFEQEDAASFSYTDGYKWCYRYRMQKLEMDKLLH